MCVHMRGTSFTLILQEKVILLELSKSCLYNEIICAVCRCRVQQFVFKKQ